MLALVDDARAEGLDVTFDLYPSEWASTRLLIMLPTWIQAGGVAPLKERLADRAVRARIRDEMKARGRMFAGDRAWDELRLGALTRPEHLEWEGRTLGELMRATGSRRRRRDLRPAARRGPAHEPGHARARTSTASGRSSSTRWR